MPRLTCHSFFPPMKQMQLLIILILSNNLLLAQANGTDKNFRIISDFEKNRGVLQSDTFDLYDHSTDGGQLIVYCPKNREYYAFDIWLFGETGKIHATYWTDKDLKFKIVKRTNFDYDRPYYERGYKVTETTEYLSYEMNTVKRYDKDKRELNDSLSSSTISVENFFQEITKDLNIQVK